MQISCSQCKSSLTVFEGSTPKFCSECGAPLQEAGPNADDQTERVQRLNSEFSTVTHQPSSQLNPPQSSEKLSLAEIGPYRLIRQLGQGGMGSVYEAIHNQTGQSVALKLLNPSLRGTEESVQRFRRESQIAASLNHPRSTFVYEAGQHEEQFYITMELMDGGTLKDVVVKHGPLEVGQAVDYILDIIDGLKVAHAAGIVHRDLKPSNCFLDRGGRVKIGDFGLAKSFLGDSQLTQTGRFMGTPQYAAPEQLRSGDVDDRVDIYAIGATLFYLLAGKPCFTGNPAQVIASIASEAPPPVSKFTSGVPRPLVRLISQALEKDPARRPPNLAALRDMLLPYSTRGASLADIGRRMAAFFIDITVAALISVAMRTTLVIGLLIFKMPPLTTTSNVVFQAILIVAYFVVCEHFYGRGVGKWLLGMRVIGSNAESPSLVSATLRAFMLPGLSWITYLLPIAILYPALGSGSPAAIDVVTQGQVIGLLSWLPNLLCMISARRSNGYRGIHELASGTRVVRLAGELEFRRLESLPLTVPVRLQNEKTFGSFKAIGRFEDSLIPVTYLGTDPELERDVWIFDKVPATETSEARQFSTRTRRLRMIHDGRQNEDNWFITESVKGAPIAEVITQSDCTWQSFRPLLLELTIELANAVAQDTLPERLDIDHVWIDDMGRIKLLDFPVVKTSTIKTDVLAQPSSPCLSQNRLILRLLTQYVNQHDVPLHARELLNELQPLAGDNTMLSLAESRLVQFADRPANWNWDDRLGVFAVTFGIESGILSTLIYLLGLIGLTLGFEALAILILLIGLGCLGTFLIGYCFNGGIAFRVSDVIILRQQDLCVATKLRCAWRNLIVWLPWVLIIAIFFFNLHHKIDPDSLRNLSSAVHVILLILTLPLWLIVITSLAIAMFYPARNVPDYLAGTRLSRQ